MSEMPPPKSFYPPPGTTKVKRRDFMQCINKSWFHDLIKNRLCVIQLESSTVTKIGKMFGILTPIMVRQFMKQSSQSLLKDYVSFLLSVTANLFHIV